jgi:hypothetical protein
LPQEDVPASASDDAPQGDQAYTHEDLLRDVLSASPDASAPPANAPERASPPRDISFFSQIVTFETVFPDPAVRALHRMTPPETGNDGRYGYSFYLAKQPGMNETRHYSVLSIIWGPAGTKELSGKLSGAAGPGGAFNEFVARTHDGLYDVRVIWSMLLPNTVYVDIDVHDLADKMVQRYRHYVRETNQSSKGK